MQKHRKHNQSRAYDITVQDPSSLAGLTTTIRSTRADQCIHTQLRDANWRTPQRKLGADRVYGGYAAGLGTHNDNLREEYHFAAGRHGRCLVCAGRCESGETRKISTCGQG